jgi:protein disulfide-isomerase
MLSGAQHIETFVKTLLGVWEEGDFDSVLAELQQNDDRCSIDGATKKVPDA